MIKQQPPLFVHDGVEFLHQDVIRPRLAWKVRVDGNEMWTCIDVQEGDDPAKFPARLAEIARFMARQRAET